MKEKNTGNLKSFHYLENGEVLFSNYATTAVYSILIPGSYEISYKPYPAETVLLSKIDDKETSKIYNFTDKEKLDTLYKNFLDQDIKDKIDELGFNHKIGVLLYGIEGTGKTNINKYYFTNMIKEKEAIVFHMPMDDSFEHEKCWDFIRKIREIQKNPIIIVLDEVDSLVQNKSGETLLKTIMDGNKSIDNCIFMATTNYFNSIPQAIKRPSRFKYCIELKEISDEKEIRKLIDILLKDTIDDKTKEELVNSLKNKTLDVIKQKCFDKIMSLKETEIVKNKIGF